MTMAGGPTLACQTQQKSIRDDGCRNREKRPFSWCSLASGTLAGEGWDENVAPHHLIGLSDH